MLVGLEIERYEEKRKIKKESCHLYLLLHILFVPRKAMVESQPVGSLITERS